MSNIPSEEIEALLQKHSGKSKQAVNSPEAVAPPALNIAPGVPGAGLDNVFIGVPGGGGPDKTGWTASETEHYNMTDRMPGWRPGLAEANYINCRPIA